MRRANNAAGWLAFALLILPACASEGTMAADGGTRGLDGGPFDASPAGADSGASVDASWPPESDGGGDPAGNEFDDSTGLDAAAARMGCFDGVDNDGDGLSDCSDLSCQANVPSCCVGQSSSVCCVPGVEQALPLAGCDGPLSACTDGSSIAIFGSPVPTVRTDLAPALIPGGQGMDSGALFLRELDPRSGALRIATTIASPLTPPEAERVEMVGAGFVEASVDLSTLARVVPLAGIVVSRNRREVLLVVAGEVIERWRLETEAPVSYTLELDPLGRLRLSSDPNIVSADIPFLVAASVRAVVYGRTANPTDLTPPARALDLVVMQNLCDMPAALSRSGDTIVPAPLEDPSWANGHTISEPDMLRYFDPPGTEVVRMALNIDGEIHLARPDLGGFVLESRIGEPVLAPPAEEWAVDGVSDPALTFDGSELHLYFTGWRGGQGTIGHAVWDPGTERFLLDGPVAGLEADGTTGFSAPSPFDIDGVRHIVLRVDERETHRLVVFRMEAPAVFVTAVHEPDPLDVFAYDRDDVDDPTVLLMDGVYRMYFAGRRGTRWSIGLLVSDDGAVWRETTENPVLSASGTGYDALGVRGPALDVVDGSVHLYHAGDDGERVRIGAARAR